MNTETDEPTIEVEPKIKEEGTDAFKEKLKFIDHTRLNIKKG
jgi:hypothetical protein